jgi:hypothetical protein
MWDGSVCCSFAAADAAAAEVAMNLYAIQMAQPAAIQLLWCLLLFFGLSIALESWRRRQEQQLYASSSIAETLINRRPHRQKIAYLIALALVWTAATAALMGPQGNPRYPTTTSHNEKTLEATRAHPQQVAIVIDASASMLVTDTRTGVSRLAYAKELADAIVNNLPGGISVSLYAFTSQVIRISPPTNDYSFIQMMLEQITINEAETSGTAFTPLIKWIDKLDKEHQQLTSFIILSDGGDNSLETLSEQQQAKYIAQLTANTNPNLWQNTQLLTVGIGSQMGGKIPGIFDKGKSVNSALYEQLLKTLALQSKGKYWTANDFAPLLLVQQVIQAIANQATAAITKEQAEQIYTSGSVEPIFDDYFQQPLSLAILSMICSWAIPLYRYKRVKQSSFAAVIALLSVAGSSCGKGPSHETTTTKEQQLIAQELRYGAAADALEDLAGAQSRYTTLLQYDLSAVERAMVLYNCAILAIRQQQWTLGADYTLRAFSSLQGVEDPPKLLKQRLYATFGLIRLNQAITVLKQQNNREMDFAKAALLYRGAKESLNNAHTLECTMGTEAGEGDCKKSPNYLDLESSLHELVKKLQSEYERYSKPPSPSKKQPIAISPQQLTEAIVQTQGYATAYHTLQTVLDEEDITSRSKNQELQKHSIELQQTFAPVTIRWQRAQYDSMGTSGKNICFKQPWDSIFPKAEQGWLAGNAALQLLEKNEKSDTALWRQWESWDAWNHVLQSLQNDKNNNIQNSSTEQTPTSSTFTQALRNLEAMQKEEFSGQEQPPIPQDSKW